MTTLSMPTKRDHALLIGDAFLLTMGTATVGLAVAFMLAALQGLVPEVALGIGSGLLLLASGVSGVLLTWLLHERRVTTVTVVGALLGAAVGGLVVPLMAGFSFILGLPLRLVTDSEFAGPLALLALVSIAVAALTVWLVVDAIRDMGAGHRTHLRLDRARIIAAAAFLILVVVSVALVIVQPGPEQGEAPIWAIAAGLIAVGAIAGADLANVISMKRGLPGSTAIEG